MDFKIELGFRNYNLIDKIIKLFIVAGLAVLLSILTFFSTPILEKIFGNGAVEVGIIVITHSNCFRGRTLSSGMPWRPCPGPTLTQLKMR